MARAIRSLVVLLALAFAFAGTAQARGGNYVFSGGTPAEQSQVKAALDASSFDWGMVKQQITVRIARGIDSEATPGTISLDADLLDSGRYAWGVVQHEYAHQVDFFDLTDAQRTQMLASLGGASWWQSGKLPHAQLASERFASTLAWAYWQSPDNVMKPRSPTDESGFVPPASFKTLVESALGLSGAAAATQPTASQISALPVVPSHAPIIKIKSKGR
jgi:hypothetical protein